MTAGRLEDGCVAVRFEDSGIGIPADMLEEVRKPFRQADGGRARRYEGMGLGLALANSIAKLHACTIDIRSVESEGTTVTLPIPESRAMAAPAPRLRVDAA